MLNKIFKLFATLSIVGVVAFGVGCSNYDNDIDNLQKQIDELKGNGDAISTALKNLEAVAATQAQLAAQADALRQEFADQADYFQGLYNGLNGNLETLKSDLAALAGSAATKADVDALESKIQGLLGDYYTKTEIDAKLSAIETKLGGTYTKDEIDAAIKAAQEALDKESAKLAGQIEAVDARLKTAEDALEALQADSDWFFDVWKPMIEQQLDIHKEWSADVVADIYEQLSARADEYDEFDEFFYGRDYYYIDEETGEEVFDFHVKGWKEIIDEWKETLGDPGLNFLGQLNTDVMNALAQIAKLNAALDGFVVYDEEGNAKVSSVQEAIDNLINLKIGADTELGKFYNNYTKLQTLFVGNVADWDARAKWLKDTGNASYAAYIEQLYSDIDELVTGRKTLAEGTNNLFVAINNTIEAALQTNGSIDKAIQDAIGNFNTDTLAPLIERISKLETTQAEQAAKIAALIDRIQSLVYVPTNSNMTINLGGSFIKYGETKILLSTEMAEDQWITYRVSPSEIAKDLAENADWYFYAVPVTRAEAETPATLKPANEQNKDFEIVEFKYDGAGLVSFRIKSQFDMLKADKNLAVALRVSSKATAENADDYSNAKFEDEVYTEFTSPYTVATIDPKDVTAQFKFARKVYATAGDEDAEDEVAGAAEEEAETPAAPEFTYEILNYAASNGSVASTYGAASLIDYVEYSNGVGTEINLFEDCEIVYVVGDDKYSLTEAAEKFAWVPEIKWGFEHCLKADTHVTTNYDYPVVLSGSTELTGSHSFTDTTATNSKEQPFQTFALTKANPEYIDASAMDKIVTYIYAIDKENNTSDNIYLDHNKTQLYYHQVVVTKDKRKINTTVDFHWFYTNWNTNTPYEAETAYDFAGLEADQIQDIAVRIKDVDWTTTSTEGDFAFIKGKDNFDFSASIDPAGKKMGIKVGDYAYNYGTKKFVATGTVDGELQETEITITVTVDAPAKRSITIGSTMLSADAGLGDLLKPGNNGPTGNEQASDIQITPMVLKAVNKLNADYLVYMPFVGDEFDGYKNNAFYSDAEVERYFATAANATKFIRQINNTANVKLADLVPDVENAKAVLNTYSTLSSVSDAQKNGRAIAGDNDAYDGAITIEKADDYARMITVAFTELNFIDNPDGITFTIPEGTALKNAANGKVAPEFPIKGAIKVVMPEVDWVQGSRLSGLAGLIGSYRSNANDGPIYNGPDFAYHVFLYGSHNPTDVGSTHDFNFENADLNTVLRPSIEDGYRVWFEVIDDKDEYPYEGTLPTLSTQSVTLNGVAKDHQFVTWSNDYYNRLGKTMENSELYNTVKVKAYLQNADGTITYKDRVITLLAEVPFNNPEQEEDCTVGVKANTPTDVNIGNLLQMINLVVDSGVGADAKKTEEMIYHSPNNGGRFYNRFMTKQCYGLKVEIHTDKITVVNTDQEEAGGVFEIGGEFTINQPEGTTTTGKGMIFHLDPISAPLEHPFLVTVPYTITGNFGYVYEGVIEFTLVHEQ